MEQGTPAQSETEPPQPGLAPEDELADSSAVNEPGVIAAAPEPEAEGPAAASHVRHEPQSVATVQKAITEVNHIIEALRDTLDEMEGVLEMLEVIERQGDADQHEIESLRRALGRLHRPRDSGASH